MKSTILAVEFLNDAGKLVDKKFLPVTGSAAIGEFTLPRELPQGNYAVKAYTGGALPFIPKRATKLFQAIAEMRRNPL